MPGTAEQWLAEVKACDVIQDHVDEEKSTGFSCARNDFDKTELEAMGQQFQRRKQALMARAL